MPYMYRLALPMLLVVTAPACLPSERDVGPEHSSKQAPTKKASKTSRSDAKRAAAKASAKAKTKTKIKTKKPIKKTQTRGSKLRGALLKSPFQDSFERTALGPAWASTSDVWHLENGRICGEKARNHPLWLDRRLPTNARIEFDAVSYSADGDIKVEIWGDGRSAAAGVSYDDATSYLAIFGGWKNTFHVLARLDEHARNRMQLALNADSDDIRAERVVPGQVYRMKVTRTDGKSVQWLVDDIEILSYNDKEPLKGAGHEHFAFNNWEARVCYDNLKITPL